MAYNSLRHIYLTSPKHIRRRSSHTSHLKNKFGILLRKPSFRLLPILETNLTQITNWMAKDSWRHLYFTSPTPSVRRLQTRGYVKKLTGILIQKYILLTLANAKNDASNMYHTKWSQTSCSLCFTSTNTTSRKIIETRQCSKINRSSSPETYPLDPCLS